MDIVLTVDGHEDLADALEQAWQNDQLVVIAVGTVRAWVPVSLVQTLDTDQA